jgi:hypothetical protein
MILYVVELSLVNQSSFFYNRLYRVSVIHKKDGKIQYDTTVFTPLLGPAMQKDFLKLVVLANLIAVPFASSSCKIKLPIF